MKRGYYHKTVVVKDVFSGNLIYTFIIFFLMIFLVLALGKTNIKITNSYIRASFDEFFHQNDAIIFKQKNVYDLFSEVIPLVKSSGEMMKKYEAFYGGVKKETTLKEEGFLDGKKSETIDMSKDGIVFNNATTYPLDLNSIENIPLEFSDPCVLIVHTHTSEAYRESSGARSTNNDKNVVMIGKIIKEQLMKNGIKVIHDMTQNDYPSYNGSYSKALEVITRDIKENSDIEVVLDIHRDYTARNQNGEEIQLIPRSEINGRQTAQMMFVVGTDNSGLTHPEWKKNLAFAIKVNKELDKISEKIARPINLRKERFNQHLTKGSLIVEVGSASNSLEEAINTAKYIGEAVSAVLKKY